MNTGELLDRAADVMQTRGITDLTWEHPLSGRVCAYGALGVAYAGRFTNDMLTPDAPPAMKEAVCALLPFISERDRHCSCGCGQRMTDHFSIMSAWTSRRKDTEIIAGFRTAAATWRMQHTQPPVVQREEVAA